MNPVMAAALQRDKVTIDPSLRLYIPFNEGVGSVAKDYSQYGNNGALANVEWGINGGKFNGTSGYVNCGNDSSLDIGAAITIKTWVKTTQTTRGEIFARWLSEGEYPGYGLSMHNDYYCNDPGEIGIWVGDPTDKYLCSGSRTINDGVWHQIVGTYDGTTAIIYIDGVLINSGPRTNGLNSTATAYIGRISSGGFFNGTIGRVEIYNRALSALESLTDYEAERGKYGV